MIDVLKMSLAVVDHILDRNAYNIPFEYPQVSLDVYPESLWGKFTMLRGPGNPETLGVNGYDQHVGVIQLDVNTPKNRGVAELLNKASEIANSFVAGQLIRKDDTCLRVGSVSVSSEREVGAYVKVSISVAYTLRAQRNA